MFRLLSAFLIFFSFLSAKEDSTRREPLVENEKVRVWKTIIMPNQPLKMHRHEFNRIVVGLKGGVLTKVEKTGERSKLTFENGKAYWLAKDLPNTLHADINESDKPVEVIVIELKQD